MIGDLARWLEARLKAETYDASRTTARQAHELQLAAAALLVEAARADHHFSHEERAQLATLLRGHYRLSESETEALLHQAGEHARETVSLTHLTQVINRHCSAEERTQVVRMMWQVAFADGRIDKYEEYVIRQVAGLLYVHHEDFVHARELARASARGTDTGA